MSVLVNENTRVTCHNLTGSHATVQTEYPLTRR